MPNMNEDGTVQITLKDVYQQQQAIEKTMSDALNGLNLTMVQIKNHIERLDARNSAADQLHAEHGARLTAVESVIAKSDPIAMNRDFETRLRSLERFKYWLLGAIVAANAAADLIYHAVTKGR